MLYINQEERRASDTVLFTNDMANQSVDTSFFTSEKKNRMTNQLASLARRDYFYLDAFWRVNLGMYVIMNFIFRFPAAVANFFTLKIKVENLFITNFCHENLVIISC